MTYREVQYNEYFAICHNGHLFLDIPTALRNEREEFGRITDYLGENGLLDNTYFLNITNEVHPISAPAPNAMDFMILVSDSLEAIVEKVKPRIIKKEHNISIMFDGESKLATMHKKRES